MGLTKSRGNMYPWVTHTHSHLRGKCSHGCSYCYVQAHERRWKTGAFAGKTRLSEEELNVRYGEDRVIFIEHQNDICAPDVATYQIEAILMHCRRYPCNEYVIQTKNPARLASVESFLPPMVIIGTTIETNRVFPEVMGAAPPPENRADSMFRIKRPKFLTIEPILDFDLNDMVALVQTVGPRFVNIGADSKGHKLPEPSADKVRALVAALGKAGIEIREKHNLGRLLGGVEHNAVPEVKHVHG